MNFDAILAAPWHVQLHVYAAFSALLLGAVQFLAPKGTLPHRVLGPIWAMLMATVILSAVFIISPRGPDEPFLAHFSFIHYIFIPLTTVGLVGGLYHVIKGGPNMKKHSGPFFGIFLGGLVIAGGFTFLPGRIMHAVVTGSDSPNTANIGEPYLYFLPGAQPPTREVEPEPEAEPIAATDIPDQARLMTVLTTLADDRFGGRAAETPGNEMARELILASYEEIGLQPFGTDGFEHSFTWADRPFENADPQDRTGINLLGFIPGKEGSDGPLFVITAHYDHVGTSPEGEIFNGADDNASGVAVLLEIARHFNANPPEHGVLIAALDAEENGLQGARAMVDDTDLPIDRFAMNLNMDMVSRADKGELYAVGSYHFPALVPVIDEVAEIAPLTLLRGHDRPEDGPQDWTYLSDQGAFIRKGIPAIYLGVEDHADYHQPTDTADKVDPDTFLRSAQTILMVAEAMDAALPMVTAAPSRADLDTEQE